MHVAGKDPQDFFVGISALLPFLDAEENWPMMEDRAFFAGPDAALSAAAVAVIVPITAQLCQSQPGTFLVKRAVAGTAVVFTIRNALVAGVVIAELAQIQVFGVKLDFLHYHDPFAQ